MHCTLDRCGRITTSPMGLSCFPASCWICCQLNCFLLSPTQDSKFSLSYLDTASVDVDSRKLNWLPDCILVSMTILKSFRILQGIGRRGVCSYLDGVGVCLTLLPLRYSWRNKEEVFLNCLFLTLLNFSTSKLCTIYVDWVCTVESEFP